VINLHYINALSLRSGAEISSVDNFNNFDSKSNPLLVFKYYLTTLVNNVNWVSGDSSSKFNINDSNNLSTPSIFSQYSPRIQIIADLALLSSKLSKFSHIILITNSYLDGYFLNNSLHTITASWTT